MRIDVPTTAGLKPEVANWINDISDLLNFGKYQTPLNTVPTAATAGQQGEMTYAKDGSTWYLYIYTNSTDGWKKVAMSAL